MLTAVCVMPDRILASIPALFGGVLFMLSLVPFPAIENVLLPIAGITFGQNPVACLVFIALFRMGAIMAGITGIAGGVLVAFRPELEMYAASLVSGVLVIPPDVDTEPLESHWRMTGIPFVFACLVALFVHSRNETVLADFGSFLSATPQVSLLFMGSFMSLCSAVVYLSGKTFAPGKNGDTLYIPEDEPWDLVDPETILRHCGNPVPENSESLADRECSLPQKSRV